MRVGRYELVRRLDRGFLGPLWVMRFDHDGESLLAMGRVLELDDEIDEEAREELNEAAWDALELQSEGVARCADVVFDTKGYALIDDFIEGQALSALYRLRSSQRVLFPVDVALRIAIDVLEAVAAIRESSQELGLAHCHGGLGPDTILVGTDGASRVLNPLVAGIATAHEAFRLRPERAPYVAPEQWRGEEADERTDVYAVGCILWELLASRRIHVTSPATIQRTVLEGTTLTLSSQEREDLNDPLRSAVEGALSSDPFARFETARAFAEALRSTGVKVASHEQVAEFVEGLAKAHLQSQRKATENSTMAHIADILAKEREKGQSVVARPTKKRKRSTGLAAGTRPGLGTDQLEQAAKPDGAAEPAFAAKPSLSVNAHQVDEQAAKPGLSAASPLPRVAVSKAPAAAAPSNGASAASSASKVVSNGASNAGAEAASNGASKAVDLGTSNAAEKRDENKAAAAAKRDQRATHVSQPPPKGPLPIAAIPLAPPPVPIAGRSPSTLPQPSRAALPRRRGNKPEHQTLLGIAPPASPPPPNVPEAPNARLSQRALRDRFAAKYGARAQVSAVEREALQSVQDVAIETKDLEDESVTRPFMDLSAEDMAPVNRPIQAARPAPNVDTEPVAARHIAHLAATEPPAASDAANDNVRPEKALASAGADFGDEPTRQWGSSEHRLLEQLREAAPANEDDAHGPAHDAGPESDLLPTEVTPRPQAVVAARGAARWPAVTWFFAGSTVTLFVVVGALLLRPSPSTAPRAEEPPAPVDTAAREAAQAEANATQEPPAEPKPTAGEAVQADDAPTQAGEAQPPEAAEDETQAEAEAEVAAEAAQAEAAQAEAAQVSPEPSATAAASAAPPPKPARRWSPPKKKSKKVGTGFIPSDL